MSSQKYLNYLYGILRNGSRLLGAANAAVGTTTQQAIKMYSVQNPPRQYFNVNSLGRYLATGVAVGTSLVSLSAAKVEEATFIMIKPDGVQRGLVNKIIKRFEQKGYRLMAIKVIEPTRRQAEEHYAEHRKRPYFHGLCAFLSSGPAVAMVWEGRGVVGFGRHVIGATHPLESYAGTIRGDYGTEVERNIVHSSDSINAAIREIALWFAPQELVEYNYIEDQFKWVHE